RSPAGPQPGSSRGRIGISPLTPINDLAESRRRLPQRNSRDPSPRPSWTQPRCDQSEVMFMVGVPAKRFLALGAGLALAIASVGAAAAGAPARAERPTIYMPPRGNAHNARPVKSKNLT